LLLALLFLATFSVAYVNGANANCKGVASLYGSGTTTFRVAAWWGTGATLAGALTAVFLGEAMLRKFSGRGLVPESLMQSPGFLLAVALGAAAANLLATRLGFPVSTTHMLVGALVGAGLAGGDGTVHPGALGRSFVQPLLLSPAIAIAVGIGVYLLLKAERLLPPGRTPTLDALHFLSGGAASFARGLNDTPKIAALLLVAQALDIRWGLVAVALAMAAGGLLSARRVAETLAHRITGMNPGEGFAANVATAVLVTTASWHGLPVSTTHVSVGALLGIGIVTRQAMWKSVSQIVAAWVFTLPAAAALAALAMWAIGRLM
jgi:inorganic phosphate transporter, PiT family